MLTFSKAFLSTATSILCLTIMFSDVSQATKPASLEKLGVSLVRPMARTMLRSRFELASVSRPLVARRNATPHLSIRCFSGSPETLDDDYSWNKGSLPKEFTTADKPNSFIQAISGRREVSEFFYDPVRALYYYKKKRPASERLELMPSQVKVFGKKPIVQDGSTVLFSAANMVIPAKKKPLRSGVEPTYKSDSMVHYQFPASNPTRVVPPALSTPSSVSTWQSSKHSSDENSLERLEAIINRPDGRTKVLHPAKFPWSMFGYMEMEYEDTVYMGSGIMFNPAHVLTAGHNLYSKRDGIPQRVTFYLGRNGIDYSWSSPAKHILLHPDWYNSESSDADLGMIQLEDPDIGAKTGWARLDILDDKHSGLKIQVTGYPGDKREKNLPYMYTMDGSVASIKRHKFFYMIDTYRGQSGSGVTNKLPEDDKSEVTCYGIHVTGDPSEGNGATRLTSDKLATINAWMMRLKSLLN